MSTTTTTTISTHPVAFHPAADHLRQAALRKKMSITQTYYLAHKARAKLSREAAQPDHDLRLLVGHANLLDSLMLELAEAEREQERWFNQSVRGASHKTQERRVQWADRIEEEAVDYDSDSSDDSSDDDYDEEDIEMLHVPAPPKDDEEMMEDDLEEDYAQLELVRTPSHSNSPPELVSHQESDSSDDESMPPSPPEASMPFPVKKQDKDNSFYEDGFYLPPRNPATISVY